MRVTQRDFDPSLVLVGPLARATGLQRWKRLLDLTLVCAAAPFIVLPLLLAVLVTRVDGGPAFFGHTRVGRGGRLFRCWKIRTMVPDAEAVLRRHLEENAEARREWAQDCKLSQDPRITPVGRFLRRSSIDELPQLWNVIIGEMSLVGPRPVTPDEIMRYGRDRWAYLAATPGITGLWQISGRNDVTYEARIQLDLQYLNAMSFWGDLAIIGRTFFEIFRLSGR